MTSENGGGTFDGTNGPESYEVRLPGVRRNAPTLHRIRLRYAYGAKHTFTG